MKCADYSYHLPMLDIDAGLTTGNILLDGIVCFFILIKIKNN
jgi:hypothetical protein